MPFFSVVIPLYNKQHYIAATLNSVLEQTFTDFEIIVINDVSTDDSLNVAESITDERIRIINHEINKGLSASRNTGIKNALADYIAFLDADDLWKPGFLEAIHKLIIHYPEASLYATKYEECHKGNVVIPIEVNNLDKTDSKFNLLDFFPANMGKLIVSFSSISIHKSIFETAGLFDETINYAEDIDFYIRAFYDKQIAYYNRSLAVYMIYDQQQMSLAGLKNKTIPDFDKYESIAGSNTDLKSFLDFYRYMMAKHYKIIRENRNYKKMLNGIDLNNLNYKQIILLYSPAFVLRLIKKLKAKLIKKGINPTTY